MFNKNTYIEMSPRIINRWKWVAIICYSPFVVLTIPVLLTAGFALLVVGAIFVNFWQIALLFWVGAVISGNVLLFRRWIGARKGTSRTMVVFYYVVNFLFLSLIGYIIAIAIIRTQSPVEQYVDNPSNYSTSNDVVPGAQELPREPDVLLYDNAQLPAQ